MFYFVLVYHIKPQENTLSFVVVMGQNVVGMLPHAAVFPDSGVQKSSRAQEPPDFCLVSKQWCSKCERSNYLNF